MRASTMKPQYSGMSSSISSAVRAAPHHQSHERVLGVHPRRGIQHVDSSLKVSIETSRPGKVLELLPEFEGSVFGAQSHLRCSAPVLRTQTAAYRRRPSWT